MRGVVDRRKEAKSCDWTNTWYCYEPSHLSIIAGQPQHLAVEVRNLSPDSLASLEQRFYGGCNCWPSIGQLRGAHGKYVHLCPADDEPKILEEPADLVLNIPLDLDKQSSADKQGFDRDYERSQYVPLQAPVRSCSLVAARLGDVVLAERYFRQAADIDLADNMGNAAGGVHAGALGGLWQAVVFGFAGLRPSGERPEHFSNLPPSWRSVSVRFQWRGRPYELAAPEGVHEIPKTGDDP